MCIPTWIEQNETFLAWLAALSLATFVATLLIIPLLVAWMPSDYFVRTENKGLPMTPMRIVGRAVKNLCGILFVLAGIAMLLLPGQGILTILVGLSLLNFPGKRKLELRLIRIKGIKRSIDWLRAKANREPIDIP